VVVEGIGANSIGAIQIPGGPSGRWESFPVRGAFDLSVHSAAEAGHGGCATSMLSRGFSLSLRAIRRQLAAMPCERYLVRLIHHYARKPFPGERLWTASQILMESTVRFLRARNREGFDIYFRPYALGHNAGYILVDLDHAAPTVLDVMCAHGHAPCAVIEASPGARTGSSAVSIRRSRTIRRPVSLESVQR
jgi:hypothetical protein